MWLQVQQWTNSFAAIFETGAKDFPLYTGVGIYPQNYPPRCRAAVLTSEGDFMADILILLVLHACFL